MKLHKTDTINSPACTIIPSRSGAAMGICIKRFMQYGFPPRKSGAGFTLIELIISLAISTILILGIVALISNVFTVNRQQGGLLSDQDQARKVSFQIMAEVRNAVTANTGAYPIETAGDQQLTFYSNVNGGTAIERIRYYVQNGKLYKGVTTPTGSPLAYTAPEAITLVQNNLSVGSSPVFFYYDDTYNGITGAALTQPVNVTSVKFVRIGLGIYNKAGKIGTNNYTVTAMAALRNVKTNLATPAPPAPQPPTVDIKADNLNGPITIAYNGTATLSWISANSTSCAGSGGWTGSVGVSGSQSTGALTTTTTYTILCTGAGGTASNSVVVQVGPAPAPTVDIQANSSDGPITIAYNTTVTLSWTSATTTSCTAQNGWAGTKAVSGTWTSSGLVANTTYTLQCSGPGGTASDSVVVQVSPPPPPSPVCTSAAPETSKPSGSGPLRLYAYGVTDTTSLSFVLSGPSSASVPGSDQGSGTWMGTVLLSTLPSGSYTVQVFVTNATYSNVLCATTSFKLK